MREAEERATLATEELADVRREIEYLSLQPPTAKDQSEERVASVEARYEVRLKELRTRMSDIERERNETEVALNRSLVTKSQEIESLKALLETSSATKDSTEDELEGMRNTIEDLKHQMVVSKAQLTDVQNSEQKVRDLEVGAFSDLLCAPVWTQRHFRLFCRNNSTTLARRRKNLTDNSLKARIVKPH